MRTVVCLLVAMASSPSVLAAEVKVPSRFELDQAVQRYVDALKSAEIPVFKQEKKVNNLTGTKEAVIVFSHPFYGTRIGECHKGARKDRPMQARIYQDGSQRVWLEYEAATAYVNEFGVIECGNEADKTNRALKGFASAIAE